MSASTPLIQNPNRIIHHADALNWLAEQNILTGCSVITSLPDISEFQKFSLLEWKNWFLKAVTLVLSRCPDDGIAIFYQTDIKVNGVWVDKGFLCQKAAEVTGHNLLAHKIICRVQPGQTTFGRPAYTHMACFSKSIVTNLEKSTPDVLPATGKVTWTRGMGVEACRLACQIVMKNTKSHTIVDPFCGHGSVLAVANDLGLLAIGVDLSPKCVRIAKALTLEQLIKGRHQKRLTKT